MTVDESDVCVIVRIMGIIVSYCDRRWVRWLSNGNSWWVRWLSNRDSWMRTHDLAYCPTICLSNGDRWYLVSRLFEKWWQLVVRCLWNDGSWCMRYFGSGNSWWVYIMATIVEPRVWRMVTHSKPLRSPFPVVIYFNLTRYKHVTLQLLKK